MTTISTLRPGILVHLSARVIGGVSYDRTDLETEHTTDTGAKVARWETRKVVDDAAEHERATDTRNLARRTISRVCYTTQISGLLCPTAREADLMAAIAEARTMADAFNSSAKGTRVEIGVMLGRVREDDVEAVRMIGQEIRSLIGDMERGIAAADPEAIRKAANQARITGAMLSEAAKGKVDAAIDEARAAATALVKRVQKDGETAATVVSECKTEALRAASFAFLDLDDVKPVESIPVVGSAVEMIAAANAEPEPKPTVKVESEPEPEAKPEPEPTPAPFSFDF